MTEYAAAATLIQLGAAVAGADGRVAAAEQDFLERRVVEALGLAEDERRRLRAHLLRTLAAPPTPAALRKRASLLPESQRRSTGDLLVALAASDGSIAPAEMDLLARLFDLLGLEKSDAYSQVHALSDETLTRMRTAGAPAPDYSIPRQAPPEGSRSAGAVVLDPELIKARLAESARAASYLAEIFTDDDAAGGRCRPVWPRQRRGRDKARPPVLMRRTTPFLAGSRTGRAGHATTSTSVAAELGPAARRRAGDLERSRLRGRRRAGLRGQRPD